MSDESKAKEEEKVAGESETSVSEEKSKDKNPSPSSESESEKIEAKEAANEPEKLADAAAHNKAADATQQDFKAFEEHVSYAADGGAIYTDPSTKQKYKWCDEKNDWKPLSESEAATAGNLYENEHYKWCHDTQQWLPKQSAGNATETEHYKWDEQQQKWLPKKTEEQQAKSDVVYGVDENGDRTYTDKDGAVFFWDAGKSAWFPKIDDDFMARYQMNYGFIDNTSAGEREKAEREAAEAKRKEEQLQRMTAEAQAAMNAPVGTGKDGVPAAATGKRKAQEPRKWFEMDPSQNTKVYVSNLPLDINMEEFAELMSKCGMVMRDPQTQKYKLKLYTEADGQIKGDGLCDYIKVESVNLALEILDEYELRGHKIRVQRAQFQMRGEYNPALKPKRKKKDKEKLQKIKEKLFDWRPDKMRGERSKNEKTVIIKNLFTPELFEREVELILEYQNNLREECGKCGTVRKVVIYDRHPEGVAQINMSSPEEADMVIQMMQGRYFGQRQLSADHWDGKTKYKIDESAAEAQERLSKWDEYLAAEDAAKQEAEETLQEAVKKEVEEASKETVKKTPEETLQDAKKVPEEATKEAVKKAPEETSQEAVKQVSEAAIQEATKQEAEETPQATDA
ncbi:HIV Tat-specific factor 1 homolog [Drosophila sulfurigaster albostrigata]|uniref:HIV Tat-specific factor 1 homolog n=1 Tax=Drosophila sulfurigaster albostrigata TaxID=89887 RepID=UPI002D219C7F|nr:HIV Tat-specific factor 1 homolog [Drosophila sulfurigaster albostrigata]XP_062130618.1 HIV Tat-specific factor 1 homolog [Drosophila sulfurigaster albostrigata]XP_062130619.1 HIV Tat-specific factor 1 homolog [Drosophila sulfurigaster albostrigata]